jgi:hypothetical protein
MLRRRRPNRERSEPSTAGRGGDLRSQVLSADPATFGFTQSEHGPLWGAVMDMGFPNGTATLVSLADGTTSLYTSTGGGIIGGAAHESVVLATREFRAVMVDHLGAFDTPATDRVPNAGTVRFFALGFDGLRSADAPEPDLQARDHPLWPIYYAAHQVITELRVATEGD